VNFFKKTIANADSIFWLTLVTASCYGLYWSFYMGRMDFYHAPTNFLKLDTVSLATIIICLLAVIPGFLGLSFLMKSLNKIALVKGVRSLVSVTVIFIVLASLSFFIMDTFGLSSRRELVLYAVVSFFLFNSLFANYLRKYIYLFFSSILGLMIALFLLGGTVSEKTEKYYVLEKGNGHNYIVLDSKEDKAIIAPVNLTKRTMVPEFQFIEMKSDKGNEMKFKYRHTGKLKVES